MQKKHEETTFSAMSTANLYYSVSSVLAMAHETCSLRTGLRFSCLTLFCCFLLGEGLCERFRVQCPEVLRALQSVKECHSTFWGGANIVWMCSSSLSGGIAIRMSMLISGPDKDRVVVETNDITTNVQTSEEKMQGCGY